MTRRPSLLAAACFAISANALPLSSTQAMPPSEEADRSGQLIANLQREPDEAHRERIYDLIIEGERIVYDGSHGGIVSPDYDQDALGQVIDELEALSGIRKDHSYFVTVHGIDYSDEADFLATPRTPPVNDLTDAEIVALLDLSIGSLTEPQLNNLLLFLDQSLGPAFSSDLIFWPYAEWTNPELVTEYRRRHAIYQQDGLEGLRAYELQIAHRLLDNPDTDPPRQYWAEGVVRAHERRSQAGTQSD